MGQRLLLTMPTSAVDEPGEASFTITSALHAECKPIIAIAGLTGSEECCLWFDTGFSWIPVEANSNDGTQVKFTPESSADIFNGAGVFGMTKPSTESEIRVTIQDGRV